MKNRILILATCLICVLAGSALAKGGKPEPPGTPYAGHAALCAILNPGDYTEDDRYAHLREAVMLYRWISDQPLTTGWEVLEMNYDLRLKGGKGSSWGYSEFEPDAYTGMLEEAFSATAKHFVWDISGELTGTGDLEGVTVTYALTQGEIDDVPADTCGAGPVLDVQIVSGYIQTAE